MSQMTMAEIPGFFDLPDANLASGQPLTTDAMVEISNNAKFAALRCEVFFMGWYANGATVPLPTSPVDGYKYSLAECQFSFDGLRTRAPGPGFVNGQQAAPAIADGNAGPGMLFLLIWDIDDSTGTVSLVTHYYSAGGQETITNDGCVKVRIFAQRLSQTLVPGTGGD